MPYSHRPYWIAACITLAACISPPTLADELSPATQRSVDYQSDIQPLLKKHCVNCHGSDKQESGLRLDARTPALQGGDSGKAITVGNSAESRLIRYVAGLDPDHLMPPEGPRLTADQIGLLRIWIDRGAEWPESTSTTANLSNHWAYQPIRRVTPPTVDLPAPPAGAPPRVPINPIDQFIIAKQIPLGLELSPEADRYTLIRRLSLDLLGLLPSVEQVDAFVNDTRPQAYEMLVDQLLKSPHFGERWGRHWLDMARYADSDGYEKDNARPDAYRWRDWVIDAINADLPFDQFTIEQLAGDLLPNANDMQRLATAFHRQTLTNTEGGTDQEQFRVEACFDRTETTGAVWLGLTVGCARCHTHKYDAITQREYYQLFSFYNNGDEKTHVVPKSVTEIRDYEVAKLAYDQQLAMLESQLAEAQKELGPALVAWEADTHKLLAEQAAQPFARKTLESISANAEGDVTLAAQKDHSLLASGKNPDTSVYTIIAKTNVAFDTLRLDALSDKSLPAKGPGRVAHGNFVLSEITLESSASEDFASATPLPLESATSDHAQADKPWLAKNAIDGDSTTGWAIGPQYGQNHWAEFRLKEPQSAQADKYLRIRLVQQYGKQHTLGRFKLSVQTGTEPAIVIPPNIVKILGIAPAERKEKQRNELLQHFSQQAPATKPLHEKIEELKKQAPAKPELTVRVLA
ncbi:MAG: DUF1549 domain-containing protein, partial [Pirellulaceae bacterium]|nr:DUF1549 domain-containing protein [Pirellulaceae bacterium]